VHRHPTVLIHEWVNVWMQGIHFSHPRCRYLGKNKINRYYTRYYTILVYYHSNSQYTYISTKWHECLSSGHIPQDHFSWDMLCSQHNSPTECHFLYQLAHSSHLGQAQFWYNTAWTNGIIINSIKKKVTGFKSCKAEMRKYT